MPAATGSPVQAVVDAIRTILVGDATLMALVTGVYGHLSEAARVAYPYVVLGRRTRDDEGGAFGAAGGAVVLQIDVWSDGKGPSQTHSILSQIAALLQYRLSLVITPWTYVDASLTCELEEVFDEPDDDSPGRRLYHGLQRWACEVHAA
jgi:hypothetical protein